jgi:hypothetical protein
MALINHNLLSVRIKIRFGEVDEAMFEGVKMPCEPIFFLLGIQKSDLDEVAEVVFQGGK